MKFRTQWATCFPLNSFPNIFQFFSPSYTKIYSLVQFLEPLCAWNRLHQVLHTKQSYSLASNNSRKSNPFLFHFRTYYCKLFRILLVKANEISITMIGSFKIGAESEIKDYISISCNMFQKKIITTKFDFIFIFLFNVFFIIFYDYNFYFKT